MILNSPDIALERKFEPLWLALAERLDTYPAGPGPGGPLATMTRPALRAYGERMPVMPMFPLGSVLLPGGSAAAPRVRAALPADDHRLPRRGRRAGVRAGADHARSRSRRRRRAGDGRHGRHRCCRSTRSTKGATPWWPSGTRRIRVNAWLPDDPYPIADVDDWPDEDPDPADLADAVAAAHERVRRRWRWPQN